METVTFTSGRTVCSAWVEKGRPWPRRARRKAFRNSPGVASWNVFNGHAEAPIATLNPKSFNAYLLDTGRPQP